MFNRVRWYVWVWYAGIRFVISQWLRGYQDCAKSRAGYTCRHRLLSNGKRECGND